MVKSLRRSGAQEKGDARILGSGEFVAQMIDETEQNIRRQLVGDDLMEKVQKLINDSCAKHNLSIDVLRSGSRRQAVSALRVREKINSQIDSVQAPAQQGAKTKEYPAYAVFSKRH